MKGLKCRYTEEMCPYIPVALSIQCDECMVKKAYKRGFYEERPHGKWGVYGSDCSNCGKRSDYRTPFCAWCGADMRKEGEAE